MAGKSWTLWKILSLWSFILEQKVINTKVIHAGHKEDKETGSVMPPIHLSSTFKQKSPGNFKYEYARIVSPNDPKTFI